MQNHSNGRPRQNIHQTCGVTLGFALALGLLLAGCSSKELASGNASGGSTGSGGSSSEPPPEPETTLILDSAHISSRPDAEFYQRAETEVDFGQESVSQALLRVKLESPCFPFEQWSAEQIPAGHNWPTLCDAFDRLIAVTLDAPSEADSAQPGLELSRAVTPFGGPATFETDVTDFVNGLLGVHRLRVDIGTWPDPDGIVSGSEGEWIVSVELVRQRGPLPRRVLAVTSLLAVTQTSSENASVAFTVPEGAGSGRIDYIATGHGGGPIGIGCSGPAEEFCRRTHTLFVDGEAKDEFSPWRSDCTTLCTLVHHDASNVLADFDYCQENPCGAVESVRAPRANWCPGSAVTPRSLTNLDGLAPGPHEFTSSVDTIATGGQWQVSATYFAYE